jgi:very-long-chain enoyl-CoA reductase
LADKTQKLSHYITSAGAVNVVFKDLGMQISWTTVFLVEYFGPILITCLLLAFREQIYGSNPELLYVQKLGVAMALIHYLKREYETLFVHRFSNDTMPWTNIIKNSAHYWAIFGGLAMYFFLRPDYTPPSWVKYEQVYTIFFWKFMFKWKFWFFRKFRYMWFFRKFWYEWKFWFIRNRWFFRKFRNKW